MRLIERLNWLHVLIFSLIGGALVGAAVHYTRPGAFTASSSLLLSDQADPIATVSQSQAGASGPSLERLKAVLVSRALRQRVMRQLDLTSRLHLDEADTIEYLLQVGTIKDIGQDGLTLTVTVGGYSAPRFAVFGPPLSLEEARRLSAEIANTYLEELRAYQREVDLGRARGATDFLRSQHEALTADMDESADRLQTLRAQYELLDPDSKAARLGERIRTLEQARADAAAAADAADSSLAAAEAELSDVDARRVASAVDTRNPAITSLEQELTRLRVELAQELARGKTTRNRDVVRIQSAIDSTEAQLATLEETVIKDVSEQPNPLYDEAVARVVQLRVDLAGARARRSETDALLSDARARMTEMPAVAREYVELQRGQQLASEELTSVERALWLAELQEARAETEPGFSMLDRAAPPARQAGPTTVLSGLIAFVALMLLQGLVIIDRRWFTG